MKKYKVISVTTGKEVDQKMIGKLKGHQFKVELTKKSKPKKIAPKSKVTN